MKRKKKRRETKKNKTDLFKKKNFFSLIEILLVMFLVALIGSFVTFRIQEALSLRRFEINQKKLSFLIQMCQELALTHQTDIQLLFEEDRSVPKITCQIVCEEGTESFLKTLSKKKVSFVPLLFENKKEEIPLSAIFYSSGFIESDLEKIEITDKKRKGVIDFYQLSYFPPKQKGQKLLHPFSLKELAKKTK